jgi:predicted Rossmann fold nucleotide-binding protein DprA/Smf involved in DNA uptake
MPHVDILAEVAAGDPEVVLIERLASEMPPDEHNADQSVERTGGALDDAEPDEQASHADDGGWGAGAPARSVRRATARRASTRRASARSRQDDSETRIIDFLAQHPGSTAGGVAKGLNLDPANVSSHLTQLAKAGEIKKTAHGYSTQQAARPR